MCEQTTSCPFFDQVFLLKFSSAFNGIKGKVIHQTERQRFIVALLLTLTNLKFKIIKQFCFEYHQMAVERAKIAMIEMTS